MRVLVRRQMWTAEVKAVSRKVEERPQSELAWASARVGDRLKDGDALRTYERSSIELEFDDGARLVVGEQSIIFVGSKDLNERVSSRSALELTEGQADLRSGPDARGPSHVEVILGDARLRVGRSKAGEATVRSRRTGAGTAQVMMFRGAGEVAAAGTHVKVPEGMGASVPRGGRPSVPEALLPAPQPLGPVSGVALNHANPLLSWWPVPGAASYTMEVCRDTSCAEIVDRVAGQKQPRWNVDGLPMGDFYRRSSAVSPSGLDGLPSKPVSFSIRSLWRRPPRLPR